MNIDIEAARQVVYTNGRVLERHRMATLLEGASTDARLTRDPARGDLPVGE